MRPNYNGIALIYDRLSQLFFGNALINAQIYLLKHIPPGSRLIIIGGGTGWILEELSKFQPSGLNITYVEMSERMMEQSMKRFTGTNSIEFIQEDIKSITLTTTYDVIFTPFLFDNFSEQNAGELFVHIHRLLKPGGKWLYCDFQLTGKWWQMFLLKSMLLFFKATCNIEAIKLPGILKSFSSNGYTSIAKETFFGDFVISIVYQSPQKIIELV